MAMNTYPSQQNPTEPDLAHVAITGEYMRAVFFLFKDAREIGRLGRKYVGFGCTRDVGDNVRVEMRETAQVRLVLALPDSLVDGLQTQ